MKSIGVEAYRQGKRVLGDRLVDLIEEHLKYLEDVDARDSQHLRKKRMQLMKPVEDGVFIKLKDVRKQTFEPWWNTLQCGSKTRNEYMTAWNVFLDWLVYDGKLDENPIKGKVRRARVSKIDQRKRRALTIHEMSSLLNVAGKHELLYLTAYGTGARFNELKQLCWDDVCDSQSEPFIVLRPHTTKNRKGRTQYISMELASMFNEARDRAKTNRVFAAMPSHHTVEKHLKLAGIEKQTDEGIACFHSLRHAFTTTIAIMTKDARLAQRMADHADITTTQGYLHTEQSEHAAVMREFPSVRAVKCAVEVVQTGQNETNDGPVKSIVEQSQVSVNGALRLAQYEPDQSSPIMEPGGIEPPCRDSQQSASTCVFIRLISTAHRGMTPCALVQPLETSSPTPQETPGVNQPENRDHGLYQTSSP